MARSPESSALCGSGTFRPTKTDVPSLAGYRQLGRSALISWIADDFHGASVIQHQDRWHEIRCGGISAHNVYLSPHSAKERKDLMLEIAARMAQTDGGSCIIVGDFNLAPRVEDGIFGDRLSTLTTSGERQALTRMLQAGRMTDILCPAPDTRAEFTFERVQWGKPVRFRCDLALVSEDLRGRALVSYDHTVRTGEHAFTDHSAIVADLPDYSSDLKFSGSE